MNCRRQITGLLESSGSQPSPMAIAWVDLIDADTEITDIMEVYRTLKHLWDLLRIWVPGADRPEPHPQSSSPSLP